MSFQAPRHVPVDTVASERRSTVFEIRVVIRFVEFSLHRTPNAFDSTRNNIGWKGGFVYTIRMPARHFLHGTNKYCYGA